VRCLFAKNGKQITLRLAQQLILEIGWHAANGQGIGLGIVKHPAVQQFLLEAQGQTATGANELGQAAQGGAIGGEALFQLILLTDEAVKIEIAVARFFCREFGGKLLDFDLFTGAGLLGAIFEDRSNRPPPAASLYFVPWHPCPREHPANP